MEIQYVLATLTDTMWPMKLGHAFARLDTMKPIRSVKNAKQCVWVAQMVSLAQHAHTTLHFRIKE